MSSVSECWCSHRVIYRTATKLLSCIAMFGVLLAAGCSEPGAKTVVGESSFDDAVRAFEEKDYGEAVVMFSYALEKGSLNADLMVDARLMRAKARIELGEFDNAQEDLDFLMEGAPDPAAVLETLGVLALKQGQIEKAKSYYQEAIKTNPKLVLPPELR